jgi:hypothetical protein
MAVNIVKSTLLTNRDARPQIPNDPRTLGRIISQLAKVKTTTGDSIASQYGFMQIPSSAIINSCLLSCQALSTSVTGDLGLWETAQYAYGADFTLTSGWSTTAGSVANAGQYFGAAITMSSALFKQQQLNQSSWTTQANMDQPVWQILGLASDPMRFFDVVLTLDASMTAGGYVVVEISYRSTQA